MVFGEPPIPFFHSLEGEIDEVFEKPDERLEALRYANPYFYHKTYIRALIGYSGEEVERMGIDEFIDCIAIVSEIKKFWHLPFMKQTGE